MTDKPDNIKEVDNTPTRSEVKIDKLSDLSTALNAAFSTKISLPKRPDKVPLTEHQKQAIKDWIEPTGTTGATCGYCNNRYSVGYLSICKADPTQFCRSKPYEPPKPKGYSDEELGYYFGWTREELEKK